MNSKTPPRVFDPLMPVAILIALAILALTIFVSLHHPPLVSEFLSSRGKDFYSVTASVAGALLGFVIAGVSIMLTMSPKGILGMFMNSQLSKQVFAAFFSSARFLGITTLTAIFGVFVKTDWRITEINFCVTVGALLIAALYTNRSVQLLQRITFLSIQENIDQAQRNEVASPKLEPRSDPFFPPSTN